MNKSSKIFLLVLMAIVAFGSYKVFSDKENKKENDVNQVVLPVVRVAANAPAVPHLLSKIVITQGYDKELGFQLNIQAIDPTLTISALLTNAVDLAVVGVVPAAQVNEEGVKVQLIGPALKLTCPFVVSSDSKAQKWQDLKGEKLGTPTKGGATYQALDVIMKAKSIEMTKYFKITEGQFFALPSLLKNGSVDAFTGVCDEISNGKWMAEGKTKAVGTMEDLAKNIYGEDSGLILSAFGVKKEWLDANIQVAHNVMQAMSKASAYIQEHPEVYDSETIRTEYKITEVEVPKIKSFISTYKNYNFSPWSTTITGLKALLDDAFKYGVLKNKAADNMFVSP